MKSFSRNLEWFVPSPAKGVNAIPHVVLPVGSSLDVMMKYGPSAWVGKPSNFFREGEFCKF